MPEIAVAQPDRCGLKHPVRADYRCIRQSGHEGKHVWERRS
jgi:hypothetical protein